jgi:phosphate transport system permease protein
MYRSFEKWMASGSPWVWLTAGAVSINIVMVVGFLGLIAARGLTHFWPKPVEQFAYTEADGTATQVLGVRSDRERVHRSLAGAGREHPVGGEWIERRLYRVGNRDLTGIDFRWFEAARMDAVSRPAEAIVVEREEWGNLYGFLDAVYEGEASAGSGARAWAELEARLARRHALKAKRERIEKDRIGAINYAMERLRLAERRLEIDRADSAATRAPIEAERARLNAEYKRWNAELATTTAELERDRMEVRVAGGARVVVPLEKVLDVYRPNAMSLPQKIRHYFAKAGEFAFDDPREANTEGGIFPAIFGTVLMVLIMSVFVTPFGVIAAVYLHEYARQGTWTRLVRVAVNNLAGVPSVVYGVFGLGFLVYFVGGAIDDWLFREALPAPTFGTPGLLWSSLTLAILTVPVVIVATEEGLSRIPRAIREGSLALGATKAETLYRTVLPMATPAMMTGLILAIARAAGEVAPLMLVGVVKLAPTLPLDANFPFLHLERKFMHLGFHIYDVGFQSPNVEAARPLVYATSFLLVVVIVSLNLAAIRIRNRLREKYNAAES